MILILHALLLQRYWPKRHGTKYTSARKDSSRDERVFGCYYRRGDVLIIMKSYHRALKLQTVTFSRQAACEEFFPPQIFEIFEGL